jgi:hypothetical protein
LLRDSITLARKTTGKELTRAEVSKFWGERANRWISENRAAWLSLLGTKFLNFWNAQEYDDITTIKPMERDGILTPGIRFGVVAALGTPGLLLGIFRNRRSRWIAAGILLHMAALLPVFITERYRLCAVPGLLLFGSYLLGEFWRSVMERRWIQTAGIIAMAGAGSWFVTISRPDPTWSLDHYKAGLRAFDDGKLATAERELATAYAYVPENAEIQFALGNLRFAQGNFAGAKHWYRQSLERVSNHPGAWNNVGVIAMQEKRWDIAERSFLKSLEVEPDDAKTFYLIARARFEAGNRQGAMAAVGEAIRRVPKQPEFLELRKQIAGETPAAGPEPQVQ